MSATRIKSSDVNLWPPPVKGHEFDLEGPTANHLLDVSHIYDQVVYSNIYPIKDEWSIVSENQAEEYLPNKEPPQKVMLGIQEKKTESLSTFDSIKLDDHFEHKKGYVINTGGSIWGLDFVPKSGNSDTDPTTQYLAVSGFKGSVDEHINIETIQPVGSYKNAIQIWKLKLSTQPTPENALLDMCILHDFGVVYDLKWCPYGVYEQQESDISDLYKLGILSFACGDGSIRTIVVPHPDAVRKHMCSTDTDTAKTLYLRVESCRCTFSLDRPYALKISWGGHKKLAAGYTSGDISVWNMESALNDKDAYSIEKSRRHLSFSTMVLDSSVRDITWNGIFEPEQLAVCGTDGQLRILSSNDPSVSFCLSRIRGVFGACGWAGHSSIIITSDSDNHSRGISLQNDGCTTLFKYGICPGFCWSIATSEHHGFFVSGTSIGWVKSLNMYHIKMRGVSVAQNVIYKLHYDESTQTYHYIDGIPPQPLDESKKLSTIRQYGDTRMAIQRVVWNPNRMSSGFIASGGAAGLCRIDFAGRGSKWL